jgi:hypothetical protein
MLKAPPQNAGKTVAQSASHSPGAQAPSEEQSTEQSARPMNYATLAQMSLSSLLYYALVGDGK